MRSLPVLFVQPSITQCEFSYSSCSHGTVCSCPTHATRVYSTSALNAYREHSAAHIQRIFRVQSGDVGGGGDGDDGKPRC